MSSEKLNPLNLGLFAPLERIIIESDKDELSLDDDISIIPFGNKQWSDFNKLFLPPPLSVIISVNEKIVIVDNPLLAYKKKPKFEEYELIIFEILDIFLKSLSLFKTSSAKFHFGKRFGLSIDKQGKSHTHNLGSSDDPMNQNLKKFYLRKNEISSFIDFYKLFKKKIKQLQTNNKIIYAIEFYSKANRTRDLIEKFIFLSISLELLFGREKDELRYRYSNRVSLLLGLDEQERKNISKNVKDLYDKRSKIIHGSQMSPPSQEEYYYLNEIIRASILQILSLSDPSYIEKIDSFILKQDTAAFGSFQTEKLKLFPNVAKFQFNMVDKMSPMTVKIS